MIIGEADSIWLACVVYFAHKNILFTLINCIESTNLVSQALRFWGKSTNQFLVDTSEARLQPNAQET